MSEISFRTTKESVIVTLADGSVHTVRKGTANYQPLLKALGEGRWTDVPGLVTVQKTVETWSSGEFAIRGGQIVFRSEPVQDAVSKRILAMVTAGENPDPLLRFYERLDRNPSFRSVQSLFGFLAHEGIPIEPDGTFLAYKSVRDNGHDHHSNTVDYTPSKAGQPNRVVKVPRNKVSDDPRTACHYGLHVGALSYARTFGSGGKILICRIDPENVVCVPYDSSQEKMRVCELEVVGYWNGRQMPSTTMETDDRAEVRTGTTPKEGKVTQPKPKKGKTEATPKFVPDKALKDKWRRWDQKDEVALNELGIDDLRKYATYHVKVVGASKIPGGKTALINNIIEVRDNGGHK